MCFLRITTSWFLLLLSIASFSQTNVSVQVDASKGQGPLEPIWAYFGYDEPNYTYMENGQKLLSEIAELSPVPVYVRAHNLLTTGEGTYGLKWGSTNAYTEDENGNPVYDWTIVDKIFDTYVERGMKPLVEMGFMPKALSEKPEPYKHKWDINKTYENIFTGWTYPPNDYEKWAELIYQWVKHSIDRYGQEEVETWLWEPWNEPNIGYWSGKKKEYFKLYDYSVDAVRRACPECKVGGPHTTGPRWSKAYEYLIDFIDHVLDGQNYATGEKGAPLDFIAYHAKGSPEVVDDHVQMNMAPQLMDIVRGFDAVNLYPQLEGIPIIIGECDPEGCAACSEKTNPQNGYRNGTMYSSYTASSFAKIYDIADAYDVNLEGALSWSFQFEDQDWFDGFRSLATNGVDKPVLNVFRMYGMMGRERIATSSTGALGWEKLLHDGVKGDADIDALASRGENAVTVMVWNYHDDDLPAPAAGINLELASLPDGKATLEHYRIDETHSNSYTLWQEMGKPQNPSPEQYQKLEKEGKLESLHSAKEVQVNGGKYVLDFELPRQGVSLIKLSW